MKTDHVEENRYNFGTSTPKGVVKWSFKLLNPSNVESINYGCYCTKPTKWDPVSGILEGTLTMANAGYQFKQGLNAVTKSIIVRFKDGLNTKAAKKGDPFLTEMDNPDKTTEVLTIHGDVAVPREPEA